MKKGKLLALFRYGSKRATASPVLPPSIMPVVILSGSAYQMGYQYGQQAGQYIEMQKDAEWVSALRRLGSRKKVIHELKGFERYMEEYTPATLEEMKGIASGATAVGYEISYTDVLLMNSGVTINYPLSAEDDELPLEGCSVFSAWGSTTADGRLICGDSKDSPFTCQVAIVAFPDDGNSYMLTTSAGMLAEHFAMNNKGLFIGTSAGRARRDIDYDWGLARLCVILHTLQFADSASDAKDMLLPWKLSGSWSLHFSDVSGDAYVVEATAALKSVRKPGDFGETDFIYSTNNYFTDEMKEAINGETFIQHAGWLGRSASISSTSRNLELWNMLNNYQGKIDLEFAKMMWRFPGNPPPHPVDKKAYYATQGDGWDQKICNLKSMRVAIALPDDGDKGVAYICTGPAGRVAYPSGPKGGDWYQIAGTHSFYQLVLASSPAAVAEAAKNEAHACIAAAHRELMALNYTDPGYAALNELYSQANAEYYEGIIAYNKGSLARGDEALRHFAHATTAFTRSQAHGKQAYNALAPPATSPEDLGLKPYGGPWAKWARK